MNKDDDLDLINDPYRVCEIDEIKYHEEYGHTCQECDIWICNNCWPDHSKETNHK